MNLKEFDSLVDLFFYKAAKENPNTDFLEWLNPKNKKKYVISVYVKKLPAMVGDWEVYGVLNTVIRKLIEQI